MLRDPVPEIDGNELAQARARFLQHGDCHAREPTSRGQSETLRHLRAPTRIALAQIVMAEWDAWLQNPDLGHTPEPVWVRMSRWREENP